MPSAKITVHLQLLSIRKLLIIMKNECKYDELIHSEMDITNIFVFKMGYTSFV